MLKPIVFASLAVLATYLFTKIRYKRFRQYAHLPQLPPSLLLGLLKHIDDYIKRGEADRHPDMIFSEMHKNLGRPPLMLVDLRPVNRSMVLVTDHEIAEQVSRASNLFPTSVPKSSLKYLEHLTGPTSILASHGDEWKTLRKRFSPGFAPQHLVTLLPCILDKMLPFIARLDHFAKTGQEFPLVPIVINLTFDIIGSVVMDVDLQAQGTNSSSLSPRRQETTEQGELPRLFYNLLSAYSDDKADLPWWLIPRIELKRRRLGRRIDELIEAIIKRKFTEEQMNSGSSISQKPRSILALSLGDTQTLSKELLHVTRDQIKTFLLAGHDTTSVTLSWVFYELSINPPTLKRVRAELDTLLGTETDPDAVRSRLLAPDGRDIINKMVYVTAVLKEALRLHPPAATARLSEHGNDFRVQTPSGETCLDGVIIYNCETIMHRDRTVYGETADQFVPERWLGDEYYLSEPTQKVPASAWRPFERGPRSCIGQEFATIEARVIIACIARRYDFTKVGLGAVTRDDQGLQVMDKPLYNENSAGNLQARGWNENACPVDYHEHPRLRPQIDNTTLNTGA